jgi:AdoMet-dependent rRNA methyltransferase SPB1
VGLDLVPIRKIHGVNTIQVDITAAEAQQKILQESKNCLFDIVLHDGAPKVGGIWTAEACAQLILSVNALKLAVNFLSPDGVFISKAFRSKEFNLLVSKLKQFFGKIEVNKPAASRSTSAEIFICCFGFKRPNNFDSRSLDLSFLFDEKNADYSQTYTSCRNKTINSPIRYESSSVTSFLHCSSPREFLEKSSELVIDKQAYQFMTKATEIRELCKDLRTIGTRGFKTLLKWRESTRKKINPNEQLNLYSNFEDDTDKKLLDELREIYVDQNAKTKNRYMKSVVSANKIKKKNSKYDLNSKVGSTYNIIENSRLTSMNSFKREKLPKRTTITARSLWAKFQNYKIRQD